MVMENRSYKEIMKSSIWQSIFQLSAWFTGMFAITHPSQPNYIAMIAGSTLNCQDNNYFSTNNRTIIDLMDQAGVSWKTYQENYTASMLDPTKPECNDAMDLAHGLYVRRHNPFIFSSTVRNSVTGCRKIVGSDQLTIDIASKNLAQVSFYTPNMKNNGHDTDITYSGKFLIRWLNQYMNNEYFTKGTLLIVTFDEDDAAVGRNNHIPAFMWGPTYLNQNVSVPGIYNHYSLVRLIEENWNLGNLSRYDTTATSLMNLWRTEINVTDFIPSGANSKHLSTIAINILSYLMIRFECYL